MSLVGLSFSGYASPPDQKAPLLIEIHYSAQGRRLSGICIAERGYRILHRGSVPVSIDQYVAEQYASIDFLTLIITWGADSGRVDIMVLNPAWALAWMSITAPCLTLSPLCI